MSESCAYCDVTHSTRQHEIAERDVTIARLTRERDEARQERDALKRYCIGVISAAFSRYGNNMDRPHFYKTPKGDESSDGAVIRAINCLRGLLLTEAEGKEG